MRSQTGNFFLRLMTTKGIREVFKGSERMNSQLCVGMSGSEIEYE